MHWQDFINFLNTLKPYVQLLITVISVFAGWSLNKIRQFFKSAKLRKLMALNHNDCEVIVPVRRGIIVFEEDSNILKAQLENANPNTDTPPFYMRVPYDYVTYDEAKILLEMHNILLSFKSEKNIRFIQSDNQNMETQCNKFCCGSFGPFRFKEKFLFGCTTDSYNHPGNENLKMLQKIADEYEGKALFWGDRETPYLYDDDYIILIKISKYKFNDNDHGTLHICFGYSARATLLAVNCYSKHINILYKKLKANGHLENYFIIMKCSKNGEIDFSDDSFLDITDRMIG